MPKPLADAQIAELETQVEQATEFVAISLDNAHALLAEVRAARQRIDEVGAEMLENLDTAIGAGYEEGATACFELRKAIPNLDRFIKDEIAEAARQEWIPVTEPPTGDAAEFCMAGRLGVVWPCSRYENGKWTNAITKGEITPTHWRPLPSAPPEPK